MNVQYLQNEGKIRYINHGAPQSLDCMSLGAVTCSVTRSPLTPAGQGSHALKQKPLFLGVINYITFYRTYNFFMN